MGTDDKIAMAAVVWTVWPWMLLIVEGLSLFFTGHTLTAVPWEPLRVYLALMWPLLWAMVFAGFSG